MAPTTNGYSDRLIPLREVRRLVGLGKTMIYRKIREGTFPRPYKISPFASRWSETEVSDWIETVKSGR